MLGKRVAKESIYLRVPAAVLPGRASGRRPVAIERGLGLAMRVECVGWSRGRAAFSGRASNAFALRLKTKSGAGTTATGRGLVLQTCLR